LEGDWVFEGRVLSGEFVVRITFAELDYFMRLAVISPELYGLEEQGL